jgi:hypothetical protein
MEAPVPAKLSLAKPSPLASRSPNNASPAARREKPTSGFGTLGGTEPSSSSSTAAMEEPTICPLAAMRARLSRYQRPDSGAMGAATQRDAEHSSSPSSQSWGKVTSCHRKKVPQFGPVTVWIDECDAQLLSPSSKHTVISREPPPKRGGGHQGVGPTVQISRRRAGGSSAKKTNNAPHRLGGALAGKSASRIDGHTADVQAAAVAAETAAKTAAEEKAAAAAAELAEAHVKNMREMSGIPKDAPSPAAADPAAYQEGDLVEVHSKSQQQWFKGQVLSIVTAQDADVGERWETVGDVRVFYGGGLEKCVDPTDRDSIRHRVAPAPTPAPNNQKQTIQGLQKLLVDVLKEVAMATDPAHRSAAEEMLGEVRAQILAQKMAEGDHMEEVQQQPQPPQQQEEQQEEAEPRGERRTDRASASSEALGQAAAARMGAMDSWLTEQQQQAQVEQQHSAVTPRADASPHSIRSSSSQPRPQSYSQPPAGHRASPSENGASSSAALRRDGAVASSRAASESPARSTRWLRRQHEQQQNQRSPPSRELREQLAVRTPQRGPPRALSQIVSPDTIGGRCDLPMSILD